MIQYPTFTSPNTATRRARAVILLMHVSFVFIIVGAVISAFSRKSGTIDVAPGETADVFILSDGTTYPLPVPLRLDRAEISLYPHSDNIADYVSYISAGGRDLKISVNSPADIDGYRILQNSIAEGVSLFDVTYDPWGAPLCFAGYILFAAGGIILLFSRRGIWRATITAVSLITCAAVLAYTCFQPELPPLLRSPWLPVHVALVASAYLMFALIAVLAIAGLISKRRLEKISVTARDLLMPAVVILGLGICAGSVWADSSWGSYWNGDPKENWALITFLVYALPLHRRIAIFRGNRTLLVYLVVAVLFVVMTWIGVNFLNSRHSYL